LAYAAEAQRLPHLALDGVATAAISLPSPSVLVVAQGVTTDAPNVTDDGNLYDVRRRPHAPPVGQQRDPVPYRNI
jgi:hypothetical protein